MRFSPHLKIYISISLCWLAAGVAQTTVEIPLGICVKPMHDSYLPYCVPERPKIALALSGGGTRGLAQIGVLKTFERHGLPVDCIAGTSMGAIIGGLYAAGYSAAQLDSVARKVDWSDILQDAPPRQSLLMTQKEFEDRHLIQFRLQGSAINFQTALSGGQQFNQLLNDLVWNAPLPINRDFKKLSIPFAAVSTDLLSGEKVVIRDGSLVEAMRASMAIPLLFTPIERNNRLLVDGGLLQNLPVSEARLLGCDLAVAVNTSSPLRNLSALKAPWEVADQVTTIMGRPQITQQLESADIQITPDLNGLTNTDFNQIELIIQAGETAAEAVIPAIDSLITESAHFDSVLFYQIHQISIIGNTLIQEKDLQTERNIITPGIISNKQIQWSAYHMLQTGYITQIHASLDTSSRLLRFSIEETPVVHEINFRGNTLFSDSVLLQQITLQPGDQINLTHGRQDLKNILAFYHNKGYSLARIEKTVMLGHSLQICIDEGRIHNIQLSGNRMTLPFVINRDLKFKTGDLFNIRKMSQALKDVYSTGYFKEVGFDVLQQDEDYQLRMHLREHLFTTTRIGMRFDSERRFKGFLEIARENILGIGAEGSAVAYLGNRDQWLDFSLHADRIYTSQLTGKAQLIYGQSEYTYYQDGKSQGDYSFTYYRSSLDFGRQMQRLGALSLRFQTENYHIHPRHSDVPLHDEKMIIQSILLKSVVDSRNRIPFPTSGKYHRFEYETALGLFGSEVDYAKISSSMESYYPIHKKINFHPKVFWATADLTTPFPKHFVIGGLDSFMGLPERALIGRRCLVINNELRVLLPWPHIVQSYFSLRYDFGGVWKSYAKIQTDDFKHGIGAILGFKTLLGPVYLGAGRMSDGIRRYYFSAGLEF